MDNRKWESGASANPPAAPASPSSGHPTDGDPLASVPPTVPGAHWFYQLGEELRAILTAAGITPDHTNLTQLLTALRSAGVFQTPAQFDNTTKAATTEFVRRQGLQLSGVRTITANESIPGTDAGKQLIVSGSGGLTLTLPAANSVPAGAAICLSTSSAYGTNTIQRAGTDTILLDGFAGISSFPIAAASDVVLVSNGSNTWSAVSGLTKLQDSRGEFAHSLSANGYQKLPSGLIIQVGSFVTSAGGSVAVTFPIAFTTACWAVPCCQFGTNVTLGVDSPSTTGTTIRSYVGSTGAGVAANGLYVAIGK